MRRVLIVTAHLDDFELGMGGTCAKMSSEGDLVTVMVLCQGDRPGHENVGHPRRQACDRNIKLLGFNLKSYQFSDTKLDQVPQTQLCNIVHAGVTDVNPHVVYTHYEHDVHKDHQLLSGVTRVACRMRHTSPIRELYEFSIPGSTEWGFNVTGFNKFVNISDHDKIKMDMVSQYTSELRPPPDPVSVEMISTRDSYHGSLCGYNKAEVFKTIYVR